MTEVWEERGEAKVPEITPLSSRFGRVVHAVEGQRLGQLSPERVMTWFQQAGVLLFRGFDPTLEEFALFTEQFTTHFVVHRNSSRRQIGADPTIQTVFADRRGLPFHGEMYYVPARPNSSGRPDLLWFYCIQPGRSLGQTILCDGVEVWRSLSQDARDFFERRHLCYRHRTPSSVWQSLSSEPSTFLGNLARLPGVVNCQVDAHGDLQWDYVDFAMHRSKYTDQVAFVNSLLPESDAYDVMFEDGSSVPTELRNQVLEVTGRLTVPIHWQALDVAMVDNTRLMHGRYLNDEDRQLVVRMSIANF